MLKNISKKIIPTLFYGLLLIFLFIYLRSINYSKLSSIQINWYYIILATVFGIWFRYWGAFIWLKLLRGLGAKNITFNPQLVYVYAKSWMGRYIPGTAPWILGKIYFASKHGISKNKLAVSSLLEGGLQINVVMIISAVILAFDARLSVINNNIKLLMALAVIAGCVSMTPAVFNRIVSFAYKIIRGKELEKEHLADAKTILKGVALYSIGAIISGVGFFFMAKAVFPSLAYSNALFVIGAASLAGAVSMLAVFAPSGLGVREGIQLALLSLIMPTEYALVVTVFTRLWSIILDIIFFGMAALLNPKTPKIPFFGSRKSDSL
ncbi:MAG: lysylphosphatidylglycerol synthase domain-containing protein [Thiobacillus sp.]